MRSTWLGLLGWLPEIAGLDFHNMERAHHPQYNYLDSKLLKPVFHFAKLIQTIQTGCSVSTVEDGWK